jgi:hypothetical protein
LREIRAPTTDLDTTPEFLGAVHTGLSGNRTVDRLAQPRRWPCKWPALTEDETTYLRMIGLGLVRGPLRLVDPEIRNRLPVNIAAPGAYKQSAADFSQTGGSTATWLAITDPPTAVPVRGVVSWQRLTTAAGALTTASTVPRVPVVPSELVRVFCYARGAAIQAAAAVDGFNTAGASTRTTGTAATLHATNWTYLEVTVTPAGDRVELAPLLVVASGQAAATLQTTGWQIAPASAPVLWTPGGGAPVVVAGSELNDVYIMIATHGFGLLLLETN